MGLVWPPCTPLPGMACSSSIASAWLECHCIDCGVGGPQGHCSTARGLCPACCWSTQAGRWAWTRRPRLRTMRRATVT